MIGLWLLGAALATDDQAPTMPSASSVLLGASSTSVARPTTAADVTVAVVQEMNGADGLPKDLSLEISPWWLFSHDLTLEQYLDRGALGALQDTSLSLATSATTTESVDLYEVALGARVPLRWGDRAAMLEAARPCAERLRKFEVEASEFLSAWLVAHPDASVADAEAAWAKEQVAAKKAAETAHKECADLLLTRRGLALDLSGAAGVAVPDLDASALGLQRAGAWLTPAWLAPTWSVSGLLGWFDETLTETPDPSYRAGARLAFTQPAFGLAPEVVAELHPEADTRYQGHTTLAVEARLADDVWLTATLGVNFPLDQAGSFVNLLSLSYDTGSTRGLGSATAPVGPK